MVMFNKEVEIETLNEIVFFDITEKIEIIIKESGILNGHVVIYSEHTTTGIYINEGEVRLTRGGKGEGRKSTISCTVDTSSVAQFSAFESQIYFVVDYAYKDYITTNLIVEDTLAGEERLENIYG